MQSGKLCSAGRNGPGDALGFALAADLDEYLRRQRWSNRALAIRTQRSSQQPRALAPLPDDAQRDRTAERRAANEPYAGPSPVLLFLAIVAVTFLVAAVIGTILDSLGVVLDRPVGDLLSVILQAAVFIAPATPPGETLPERMVIEWFDEELDTDGFWAKYNRHFWARDYPGFVEFLRATAAGAIV